MIGEVADEVWYVAYGSNLSADRLRRYLARCDPSSDPLDRRPMVLDHRLFFADHSTRWGGGCAFVDPEADVGAGTLATAWLVPVTQFLGIWAAENGVAERDVAFDPAPLSPGEARLAHPSGRYGLVLGCPSPDRRSALTFTTPERPLPDATPPSDDYVATIVAGLIEGHGLSEAAARTYVAARMAG